MLMMGATTAVGAGGDASASSAAPTTRLIHAAHEFEAQMMKELLKPMISGNGLDGEEGDASGAGSTLQEFATEALGRGLSDRGGFGIATSIVKQLSSSGNHQVTSQ